MSALIDSRYTRALKTTHLLTAQEERELAESIWEGRRALWRILWKDVLAVTLALGALPEGEWTADAAADKDLDEEALAHVFAALEQQGCGETLGKARAAHAVVQGLKQRFAECNLRLVITVAARSTHWEIGGIDEAIGEGNLGLMTAVRRFDPARGYRFSTYATWWIRHAINRAIQNKSRTVRVPVHARARAIKLRKFSHRHEAHTGRAPSTEALAAELDCAPETVERLKRVNLERAISLDPAGQHPGDDARSPLALLEDPGPRPDTLLGASAAARELHAAMKQLTAAERDIVNRRFGFGRAPQSLREVGEAHDLSRERIRQIEQQALIKLRAKLPADLF